MSGIIQRTWEVRKLVRTSIFYSEFKVVRDTEMECPVGH